MTSIRTPWLPAFTYDSYRQYVERVIEEDTLTTLVEDVELLAPVLLPGKFVCVGLNYRDHAEEIL